MRALVVDMQCLATLHGCVCDTVARVCGGAGHIKHSVVDGDATAHSFPAFAHKAKLCTARRHDEKRCARAGCGQRPSGTLVQPRSSSAGRKRSSSSTPSRRTA